MRAGRRELARRRDDLESGRRRLVSTPAHPENRMRRRVSVNHHRRRRRRRQRRTYLNTHLPALDSAVVLFSVADLTSSAAP